MSVKARQKMLRTFQIDFTSAMDDCRYQGGFTTKKLTIRDLAALGVRKAQLNGGLHHDVAHPGHGVDEETDQFNNMIAHLELALTTVPQWWDMDILADTELLAEVYREVIAFETSFLGRERKEVPEGKGTVSVADSQGDGTQDTPPSDDGGAVSSVVGAEVQAALEP